jgi:hypothetical protein
MKDFSNSSRRGKLTTGSVEREFKDMDNAPDPVKVSTDFHLREWESLRKEIESQIEHTRKLELAVVGGLGAFYAWFVSEKRTAANALVACHSNVYWYFWPGSGRGQRLHAFSKSQHTFEPLRINSPSKREMLV